MNGQLFHFYDLTSAFNFVWGRFLWVVEWAQTNFVTIGTHTISFFELAMGMALTWLVVKFIPIFGGISEDDVNNDDEWGYYD